MHPIEGFVHGFQDLVGHVPEIGRPFVVMLAGAIPFIEGEGASPIGVLGGINPVVAGTAAAIGNFLCVVAVVFVSSRVRTAVVANRAGHLEPAADAEPVSKGRRRFQRWVVRFGVPGASILGPLAIPTQFTSAALVATGVPIGKVLLWQAVSIALWTTVTTTLLHVALTSVMGA